MESALDSFRLLTSQDIFEAGWLAQQLDSLNSSRKEITNQIIDSTRAIIAAQDQEFRCYFPLHQTTIQGWWV